MNILAWLLSLTILTLLLVKAVAFHEASVCRQKAWLKSTELATGALLYQAKSTDMRIDPGCKVYVTRKDRKISWRRSPNLKAHKFDLPLSGKL